MIFPQIFDMINAGIVILDKNHTVTHWNRWMEMHSKIPASEIVGSSLFTFFPNINTPWFLRNIKSVFTFGNFAFISQKLHKYCFPFKAINVMGSNFDYMQQDCTAGPLRNENNQIESVYLMIQDVTEVAAYEQRLLEMNHLDGLTGIYNRLYFETRIEEEFDRHKRYARPFSMIIIDIDHFKRINDDFGHQCGDYILKSLTKLIADRIRAVDILARYGGEEFCLLLPETDITATAVLSEKLRKMIETEIFNYGDTEIHITISQGASEIKNGINSPEELFKKADDALYEAKRSGRNKVVIMQ